MVDAVRLHGTVKWFNCLKGYGFISRDDGDDVFVHASMIDRPNPHKFGQSLDQDEAVDFQILQDDVGRLQAGHVTGANGECVKGSRFAYRVIPPPHLQRPRGRADAYHLLFRGPRQFYPTVGGRAIRDGARVRAFSDPGEGHDNALLSEGEDGTSKQRSIAPALLGRRGRMGGRRIPVFLRELAQGGGGRRAGGGRGPRRVRRQPKTDDEGKKTADKEQGGDIKEQGDDIKEQSGATSGERRRRPRRPPPQRPLTREQDERLEQRRLRDRQRRRERDARRQQKQDGGAAVTDDAREEKGDGDSNKVNKRRSPRPRRESRGTKENGDATKAGTDGADDAPHRRRRRPALMRRRRRSSAASDEDEHDRTLSESAADDDTIVDANRQTEKTDVSKDARKVGGRKPRPSRPHRNSNPSTRKDVTTDSIKTNAAAKQVEETVMGTDTIELATDAITTVDDAAHTEDDDFASAGGDTDADEEALTAVVDALTAASLEVEPSADAKEGQAKAVC